jgi:hypothetical protein
MSMLQAPLWVPGQLTPMFSVFSSLGVVVTRVLASIFWGDLSPNNIRFNQAIDCILQHYQQVQERSTDVQVTPRVDRIVRDPLVAATRASTACPTLVRLRRQYEQCLLQVARALPYCSRVDASFVRQLFIDANVFHFLCQRLSISS